jgi:rubredoxin
MPYRLCPRCKKQGRLLEHISQDALVEYYRCDPCNHAWTHAKGDPQAPPQDVTIKPVPPTQTT